MVSCVNVPNGMVIAVKGLKGSDSNWFEFVEIMETRNVYGGNFESFFLEIPNVQFNEKELA